MLGQGAIIEGRWANTFAVITARAEPAWQSLEGRESCRQGKEAPQRAETPAPGSPAKQFQYEDAGKNDERQKGKGVKGLAKGQHVVAEKPVSTIQIVSIVAEYVIKSGPPLPHGLADHGIKKKGKESHKNCQGVEKARQVDIQQGSEKERQKQVVPGIASNEAGNRRNLWNAFCSQVKDCTQRTEPTAEESAEEHCGNQDQHGRQEEQGEGFCRENVACHDEGVKAKEDIDGKGYFILAAVIGQHEEYKEDGEEKDLRETTEDNNIES